MKPTLDITVRNGSSSSIGLSFKARFIDGTGRLVREPYESCDIPAGTSLGPIRFFTFISYKDTFQSDEEFREALSNPNHPNHPTKWKVDLLAAAKGASDNEYRVIYSSALNIRR